MNTLDPLAEEKRRQRQESIILIVCAVTLFLLILLNAGCATAASGKPTLRPIITVTNVVESIRTNTVTQIIPVTVTNTGNELRTVWQTNVASMISTNWQTNIVSEVNPAWQTTIAGAKTLNETLNPTPTAPFVNIGLSVLSGALAWFAGWKNKLRAKEAGMVNTLIAGVEAAKNPDVKKAIAETAVLFGNDKDIAVRWLVVTSSGPNPS